MFALYDRFCNAGQNTINTYFPEVPRGTVRSACNNFALNFVLTALASKGNLRWSIRSCGIGVLVITIQTVALTILNRLKPSLLESRYTSGGTYLLAIFTTRALGVSIDIKNSLITTLMVYSVQSQWE